MAVIVPPGQQGLEGEIAALKQQVAELSRRRVHRPVCAVYLATNFNIPHTTDTLMGPNWSVYSDKDNMWTPGNPGYVTIPCNGHWNVTFQANFQDYCFGDRYIKVLKNGTTVTIANVFDSAGTMATGDVGTATEGTIVQADNEGNFVKGDKLYFSAWQRNQVAGNTGLYNGDARAIPLVASSIMGAVHITVRYLGPELV